VKTFAVIPILIVILVILGTGSGTVWGGVNIWTSLGPDGGLIRALAVDPQDPSTVYAGTHGGVFKTTNGGTTWGSSGSLKGLVGAYAIDCWQLDHNSRT
jgi:photosystem II stability/assembly factor-like uncharacterized protein